MDQTASVEGNYQREEVGWVEGNGGGGGGNKMGTWSWGLGHRRRSGKGEKDWVTRPEGMKGKCSWMGSSL